MNYKIEILDDCNVIYVRNKGKYGSNKNYEMMKNFKEWIKKIVIGDMLKLTEY